MVITDDLMARLWAKVDKGEPDECWPFTGYRSHGYGRIGLGSRADGVDGAHRVVAWANYGPPNPGHQARHLCGNRACCNPDHIAWGDQSANEMDKVAHGLSNRGSRHGMSKLTEGDVRDIRRRCANGEYQYKLADEYGIAQQSVSELITGKTWGWLVAA
jgi:hypothetical protein